MKKVSNFICKKRKLILIIFVLLLIPTIIGIKLTKINYDILVYLPDDIETMKGEKILSDDFNMGSFSTIIIDNMNSKDILNLESNIKNIEGVEKVFTIYDLTGNTIPIDFLPSDIINKVKSGNSTLMFVTFSDSTSSSETLNAVSQIRSVVDDNILVGGMSSMALDTMNLSQKEIAIYILIAVILCIIVLMISLDSYLVPIILLANIGVAILYNMGTNIFLGNISYITKAISSVLQLGVTTDFSIFLYHKYEKSKKEYKNKEEAMSEAIKETMTSVIGSSLTTIAGFLALCTMNLTLGKDIGIVMAKGVLFGLICVIFLFPALLLIFDKQIDKTMHKPILPNFIHLKKFIIKHYKLLFTIFILLIIPAWYGSNHTSVYYNLDKSLPDSLECIKANTELKEKLNIVSPEIILIDKDIKANDINEMLDKIENINGIDYALAFSKLEQYGITLDMLDEDTKAIFENDKYQMILVNSTYEIATDQLNNQISEVNDIVKSYDTDAIVAGEGPLMKDLISISNQDFKNVNYSSIFVIFIIMIFVLKSISLPVILVSVIEFAIFINMSVPYYTGVTIPFVASIVIGTIQLGATIDYAILMTTKYLEERKNGKDKKEAIKSALDNSVNSIFVSGLCFFAATFGVGFYSKLDMISAICTLIARGAIISMLIVVTILPSFLLIFDKVICKTTIGFKENNMKIKKFSLFILISCLFISPVSALTKNETVYSKLNSDGSTKSLIVNEDLINSENTINDVSNLKNILNINGDEDVSIDGYNLTWDANGNNIYYQGETDNTLPISVSVTYKLNGEEKSIDDILGCSGTVSINLEFTNTESHQVSINGKLETLYTPFVVTLGTIIPESDASNITVTNGKVISNGIYNIVVGLATPGLYDSLGIDTFKDMNSITITYNTDNFSLNTIYSAVTPKIIDSSDLDIFDDLDSVYTKINTLSSASNELVNGSKKLLSGVSSFNTNFKEYNTGINNLYLGSKSLVKGYDEIYNGIDTLTNNINTLSTLVTSLNDLNMGINTLKTNSTTLKSGSDLVIPSTINVLNSNITTINTNISNIDNNIALLETSKTGKTDEEITDIDSQINVLNSTKEALEEQVTNLNSLIAGLNNIKDGITGLDNGLLSLQNGSNELINNLSGISDLINGANQLNSGSSDFKEGLNTLYNSISTIKEYSNEFNTASDDIYNGTTSLTDGIISFDEEGIQTLADYVNVDLKNTTSTIKELVKLGEDYQTFTMKSDDTTGTTKFVLVIDSKKKEVDKTTNVENTTKESLWTKIVNIFKRS